MRRRDINPFYAARTAIRPNAAFRVLDLFSGIGGFSLGLERAGMQTVAFCEIDPFCRGVLAKHWPGKPIYNNIRKLTARRLYHDNIRSIDLICGGYPCQPFSIAGQQLGEDDPRHLWPEMHRLIREVKPRWVICENVDGHIERGLDTVLDDLEASGYAAWPFVIPACAIGAPHRRNRLWIIAHAAGLGRQPAYPKSRLLHSEKLPTAQVWRELPTPFTCGSDDGIPYFLDRLRALGNAVVPQIPELIGRAVMAYERQQHIALN